MKLLMSMILILGSMSAYAGNDGRGGGDPKAAEFLASARAVCEWMRDNESLGSFGNKCYEELYDMSNSLNSTDRKPRISSTDEPVLDDGVEKDAVTDLNERTIIINRPRWEASGIQGQQMTSAMEMALLIGIPRRYDVAQNFLQDMNKKATAGATPCSSILQSMTKLIDSYIRAMKSCYDLEEAGKTNSKEYKDEKDMASLIADAYGRFTSTCESACQSVKACSGPQPYGACKK